MSSEEEEGEASEQPWQEIPSVDTPDNSARQRGPEEGEVFVPPLRVNDRWVRYQRAHPRKRVIPPMPQTNVYGTHKDINWEREGGQWVNKGKTDLPIHAAPNWSDIWRDWANAGSDYIQTGTPLHHKQEQSITDDDQTKVTNWMKKLDEGAFAEVWQIEYIQQTAQGWSAPAEGACKVIRLKRSGTASLTERVGRLLQDTQALQYLMKVGDERSKREGLTDEGKMNIVRMIDVIYIPDSRSGFPFATVLMVMELCHGDLFAVTDLFGDFMPMSLNQRWMQQITAAIKFLHQRNIVHLDIKPENIMFQRVSTAQPLDKKVFLREIDEITFKLGDFGFAMAFGSGETAETDYFQGTESFMSPEMGALSGISGTGQMVQCKPCDIYSLGITLSFCLMEYSEFKDHIRNNTLHNYMESIGNGQTSDPYGNLTWQVAGLIARMLADDPNVRPTIEAVANNLWLKYSPKRKLATYAPTSKYIWHRKRSKR